MASDERTRQLRELRLAKERQEAMAKKAAAEERARMKTARQDAAHRLVRKMADSLVTDVNRPVEEVAQALTQMTRVLNRAR